MHDYRIISGDDSKWAICGRHLLHGDGGASDTALRELPDNHFRASQVRVSPMCDDDVCKCQPNDGAEVGAQPKQRGNHTPCDFWRWLRENCGAKYGVGLNDWRMLRQRKSADLAAAANSPQSKKDVTVIGAGENLRLQFCSETTAESLQRLGALSETRPSNSYVPLDFAPGYTIDHGFMCQGFRLSEFQDISTQAIEPLEPPQCDDDGLVKVLGVPVARVLNLSA
jgi:hypothetical protein